MDNSEHLSKKDLKQIKRLQALEKEKTEKNQNTVKWIAISALSILFLGFFTFIIVKSKQNAQNFNIPITNSDHIKGNPTAKNTLVEFSDFECPACKLYAPYTQNIAKDFNGKLKLVYKHYPLSQHPNAQLAAQAAEAAGKQGKFWEMHDLLFEKQEEWSTVDNLKQTFTSYAQSLNLNTTRFEMDLNSKEVVSKVKDDQALGDKIGLSGTPTFFINGKPIEVTGNYSLFRDSIQKSLTN